jgi:hypothetical protein
MKKKEVVKLKKEMRQLGITNLLVADELKGEVHYVTVCTFFKDPDKTPKKALIIYLKATALVAAAKCRKANSEKIDEQVDSLICEPITETQNG